MKNKQKKHVKNYVMKTNNSTKQTTTTNNNSRKTIRYVKQISNNKETTNHIEYSVKIDGRELKKQEVANLQPRNYEERHAFFQQELAQVSKEQRAVMIEQM